MAWLQYLSGCLFGEKSESVKSAEFVYSSAIQNLRNILSGKKIEIILDKEIDLKEIGKKNFLLPFLDSENESNYVPNIEYFGSLENGKNNGEKLNYLMSLSISYYYKQRLFIKIVLHS